MLSRVTSQPRRKHFSTALVLHTGGVIILAAKLAVRLLVDFHGKSSMFHLCGEKLILRRNLRNLASQQTSLAISGLPRPGWRQDIGHVSTIRASVGGL
jgi:hypothetical protein